MIVQNNTGVSLVEVFIEKEIDGSWLDAEPTVWPIIAFSFSLESIPEPVVLGPSLQDMQWAYLTQDGRVICQDFESWANVETWVDVLKRRAEQRLK